MGGVRARKSRRSKVVNSTKITTKKRRRKVSRTPTFESDILKKHWDGGKTLKQNLKHIGIAFNPNDIVSIHKKKKSKDAMESEDLAAASTAKLEVIEQFEHEAAQEVKTERFISKDEARFILLLRKDYGSDYKAMARDKRNYQQHTPNQLRRKCENFLKSPYYTKYSEDVEMSCEME